MVIDEDKNYILTNYERIRRGGKALIQITILFSWILIRKYWQPSHWDVKSGILRINNHRKNLNKKPQKQEISQTVFKMT